MCVLFCVRICVCKYFCVCVNMCVKRVVCELVSGLFGWGYVGADMEMVSVMCVRVMMLVCVCAGISAAVCTCVDLYFIVFCVCVVFPLMCLPAIVCLRVQASMDVQICICVLFEGVCATVYVACQWS